MSKDALYEAQRPSSELLQKWIQKHADLLIQERKVEQEESKLLLSKCPPKQLERNGVALLGLGVVSYNVGLGGKSLIELERPAAFHTVPQFPPHSFRPGDIVELQDHEYDLSLSKPKTSKEKTPSSALSGVVYRVMESKIIIAASGRSKEEGLDQLPNRIRIVKVANEATFNRMEHFLLRLAKVIRVDLETSRKHNKNASSSESEGESGSKSASSSASNPSSLISALLALAMPTWSREKISLPLPLINKRLNASQLDAIQFALQANHFALIHGPPGTGKTTAVAELILQLAIGLKQRVLVCGASNLAADNLLERIVDSGGEVLSKSGIGVTRLGHPARVLKSLIARTLDYQAQFSEEGGLIKDIKQELEEALASLQPREAAGNKSTSKRGQASTRGALNGKEKNKRRDEIRLLRKEYRKRERGLLKTVLDNADIVVATCHGAGGRQLDGVEFDVVVIDEACQATEASCWIPIMRAKSDGKLILAGDHLQLPPTVKGIRHSQVKKKERIHATKAVKSLTTPEQLEDGDKEGSAETEDEDDDATAAFSKLSLRPKKTQLRPPRSLESTMFSRLLGIYGPACKALLDVQYRMNEEIMHFPNTSLYEGKIKADTSCASIRLLDIDGFATLEAKVERPDDGLYNAPLVFYDTAGSEMYESKVEEGSRNFFQSESKSNVNEIAIVSRHVEMLIKLGLDPSKISILSPYNLQVSIISDHLRSLKGPFEHITVGSIDSMQGMENEVIILSLVRSNDQREVGFLAEKKRLNVAMTRAKRQLCIVGDSGTIGDAKDDYLTAWMSFLEDHALIEPSID